MSKSKYYIIEENLEQIRKWKRFGATEEQMMEQLGIGKSAWYDYKSKKQEFADVLKDAQKEFVQDLKGELAKLAQKHTLITSKSYVKTEDGKTVEYTEVTKREVDANIGAIHLLLKNLDRDDWNNDWASYELKKAELELKKQMAEEKSWN